MQRKHSWKHFAHLLICLSFVTGLLLPTTAFANDKDKGKAQPAASQPAKQEAKQEAPKPAAQTSTQTQAPAQKNEDRKDDNVKPVASQQTEVKSSNENAHKQPVNTTLNDHPSGKDRNTEPGGSGAQGKSTSDPDGKTNGGPDKPGGSGGFDADKDGNNGCGNDDDFEDDNNGWCGRAKANLNPPPPGGGGEGSTEDLVPVEGCYEWKDSGLRFFQDLKLMTKHEANQFRSSTHFISDTEAGCQTQSNTNLPEPKFVFIDGCYRDTTTNTVKVYHHEKMTVEERDTWLKTHVEVDCAGTGGTLDVNKKVFICHRTGSMTNPFVLIEVSVNAEGHDDADADHKGHQGDIHFDETLPNNWREICKLPEDKVEPKTETKSFPLSGCFFNPVTKEYVYFDAQTFSTQAAVDAKIQGLTPLSMDRANCKPPTQTLGTRDEVPNLGGGGDNPAPVDFYGCFIKADGTVVHEQFRTFSSQADMEAYKASKGYVGIDTNQPNADQCKNPERGGPPTEVAGIQTEPGPTIFTSIAV